MPKDLRTFLTYLQRHDPGGLVCIDRPVDRNWEIAAVLRRFWEDRARYGYPAILFEHVRDSAMPVLTNALGARSRLAAMLETDADPLDEYMRREEHRIPPRIVPTGPVKEQVVPADRIDITRLPSVWHAEKDGGPYVTAGVVTMKNPATGVQNVGLYRLQPKGPRRFGISLGTHGHGNYIMRLNEEAGRDTEVAIAIGHHPAVVAGTQGRLPDYVSEFDAIGGLLGEPLDLTPAETVDLLVPARAEIVIEGRIPHHVREMEGPLGEYTWYYGPARENPVVEVTCVSHRTEAIFYDINSALHEHSYTQVLALESQVFKHIRSVIPTLRRVRLPDAGCCRFLAFVQIDKRVQGQGVNAALTALAADAYIKVAVVVDMDVDIDDDSQVWWAVLTRSQASKQWFFVPGAHIQRLLPISHSETTSATPGHPGHLEGLDTKVGIDATLPLSYGFAERQDVRRADWEQLDLAQYLRRADDPVSLHREATG